MIAARIIVLFVAIQTMTSALVTASTTVTEWKVKPFDEDAYDMWSSMSRREKLTYLLNEGDVAALASEFLRIVLSTNTATKLISGGESAPAGLPSRFQSEAAVGGNMIAKTPTNGDNTDETSMTIISNVSEKEGITLDMLLTLLDEFQSSSHIQNLFMQCDEDHNSLLNFEEYILCRGQFDISGNEYEVNEYDVLENVLVEDFEQLKDRSDFRSKHYTYDENGMIID